MEEGWRREEREEGGREREREREGEKKGGVGEARRGERGGTGREREGEKKRREEREGGWEGKEKERRQGGASGQLQTPHLPSASSTTGNNMPTTIRKQLKMMGPANTINIKNPEASKYCC